MKGLGLIEGVGVLNCDQQLGKEPVKRLLWGVNFVVRRKTIGLGLGLDVWQLLKLAHC